MTLLGRLTVEKRSAAITRFRTQQTGALLARLALFPRRVHSREELVDLLWPEDDPETARAKLRIALSALRRQLEPPGVSRGSVLQADRTAVCLNSAAVTTDVARFEAALARIPRTTDPAERERLRAQALAVYAGELMPGYYADWIIEERERLEALAEHARSGGDPSLVGGGVDDGQDQSPPKALPHTNISLPPQWTRFFGRDAETEQIHAWLCPTGNEQGIRLVTLTGPGGVGKSRLSVEAARMAATDFPGGVYFLGLADVRESDRLFPLIAARLAPAGSPPDDDACRTITDCLGGGPALLVLDNLEQMADELGPRIQNLLALLPDLRCLTTSRRVLGVPGEHVLPLEPLPAPAEALPVTLSIPSVALFVDRARTVRPDFALSAGNSTAVGRLCARLDGLPLALELAAAWIGVLTPAQMLARMESQPLTARHKDAPDRHRTLWDAAAWSFDLLPVALRETWTRLSIFRGGWTPEAMTTVCETEDALESLSRLRDRSLLTTEVSEDGGQIRFRMLESLREFAQGQLTREDRQAVARRHAAYFLNLAEAADQEFYGPHQAAAMDRLEADHENLRAAMDWYAITHEGAADGLLMAASLQRFWWVRGFITEGRRRSASALAHPGAARDSWPRARILLGVSVLARLQGDNDESHALCLECLEIVRPMGKPSALAAILGGLGNTAKNQGEFHAAQGYYNECLEGARTAGMDRVCATALVNLGGVAVELGQSETARRHYDESLSIMRRIDDQQGVIVALTNLSQLDCQTGDLSAAHRSVAECLTLCWDLMDKSGLTYAFEVRAHIALAERQFSLATTLYAAAAALRGVLGTPLPDSERAHCDLDLALLRETLAPSEHSEAWKYGESLSLGDAVALARDCEIGDKAASARA